MRLQNPNHNSDFIQWLEASKPRWIIAHTLFYWKKILMLLSKFLHIMEADLKFYRPKFIIQKEESCTSFGAAQSI